MDRFPTVVTRTHTYRPWAWTATIGATVVSTYALDAAATAAGAALVASGLLASLPHAAIIGVLVASYVAWGAGLRLNLQANWALLRSTGASSNALSKAAYDLTRRRSPRVQRRAAAGGYIVTELVKEAPYYAGAFGAALVTDSIDANDALLFLAGANLGAAVYELGLARLTRAFLRPSPRPGLTALLLRDRLVERVRRGARELGHDPGGDARLRPRLARAAGPRRPPPRRLRSAAARRR